MSEPFLAEVRIVGFNFAPRGWAFCDGQILPINQNQSLYSLLGTTYGGDGRTSFALPDLRGRTPMHPGASTSIGQQLGTETVTLAASEMPAHRHSAQVRSESALLGTPSGNQPAPATPAHAVYGGATNLADGKAGQISNVGGQAHDNMQPTTVLNYCIALTGLFPSRN